MWRRVLLSAIVAAGVFWFGPAVPVASACPMCKAANETDSRRPRAYMVSILFMLAVPATLFGGLSLGLYRMSRKEVAALKSLECNDPAAAE